MLISYYLKYIYFKYTLLIHRLLILIGILCLILTANYISSALGINLINNIKDKLFFLYIAIPQFVLQLMGYSGSVMKSGNIIQLMGPNAISLDAKIFGLRYFILAIGVLFISIQSNRVLFKYSFFTILAIPLLSSVLILIRSLSFIASQDILSLIFESVIVIGLLCFIYWNRQINKTTEYKLNRINSLYLMDKELQFSFYCAVFLFFMLVQIILKYSIANDILADIIMYSSKWILNLFNYHPDVFGRNLKGDNAWIEIRNMCLGTNVMLVYSFFILVFAGHLKRKFVFIINGIVCIILINFIRIVFLYVYLDKNGGIYDGFLNVHDLYNYPVYISVLLLWACYLKKLNLNFFRDKL